MDTILYWGGLYFSDLVGFILAHVFTYYLKIQLQNVPRVNVKKYGCLLLFVGVLGWLLGAAILNYAGIQSDFIGHKFHQWNRFFNPFILTLAYGGVLFASTIEFYSMIINKLSGASLYVYMITGNQLLRIFPDNALYDWICDRYGMDMYVCFNFVVLYAIAKYIMGTGIAIIYQNTLGKVIKSITIKECDLISNAIGKIK